MGPQVRVRISGIQVNHTARRTTVGANSLIWMRSMLKWVGLAGAAGVVAGGVLVARDQRKRRAYTADEVRSRLRQRLAEYEASKPGR